MAGAFGQTAWAVDPVQAKHQAEAWVIQTATNRGWQQSELDAALRAVDSAGKQASTADEFWTFLIEIWAQASVSSTRPAGWDSLGRVWAQAAHTSWSAAVAAAEQPSAADYWAATVESLGDIATVAAKGGQRIVDVADPKPTTKVLLIVGLLALTAYALKPYFKAATR